MNISISQAAVHQASGCFCYLVSSAVCLQYCLPPIIYLSNLSNECSHVLFQFSLSQIFQCNLQNYEVCAQRNVPSKILNFLSYLVFKENPKLHKMGLLYTQKMYQIFKHFTGTIFVERKPLISEECCSLYLRFFQSFIF